jgi:hypothetical protein
MKKILALTIGFLLLSGIYSCKREGCTDSSSKNHSSKAKKDDGTCEFESRTSFWFNQNVSNFLTNYGVTTLHVYIDDISVGEIDIPEKMQKHINTREELRMERYIFKGHSQPLRMNVLLLS